MIYTSLALGFPTQMYQNNDLFVPSEYKNAHKCVIIGGQLAVFGLCDSRQLMQAH